MYYLNYYWSIWTAVSPEVKSALITVLGVIFGARLLYISTLNVAQKNLFVVTVTTERAKWREELREATSRLYPAARAALRATNFETLGELDRHRIAIRLRLNPSREDKHRLDRDIMDALRALMSAVRQQAEVETWTQLEKIERAVQKLIKIEWEKSKREAQTGRLQP